MKCDSCKHAENCPAKAEYGGAIRCSAFKPQEMTNEEWLRSCTTEQLAEEIVNLTLFDKYKLYDQMESAEYEHGIGVGAKKVIVEWLKQPHREE